MGLAAKKTPDKYCKHCGTKFNRKRVGKSNQLECYSNYMRRKFCSLSCSVSNQHTREAKTAAASRKRAQRFVKGFCEACGHDSDLTIHHINGDPMDNRVENLQTLCRYCHSYWHSTLIRISKQPIEPMPRIIEWASCAATVMPSSRKSRRSS